MNERSSRRVVVASGLLWIAAAACSEPGRTGGSGGAGGGPTETRTSLDAAHHAYLDGDFVAVTERIRDVLVDPASSHLARENAYALLEKSYEAQSGRLAAAFKLPEPFDESFRYQHVRSLGPNGVYHSVKVRGAIRDASRITQLVVRRLPNEIVLDKKAGKGTFEVEHDTPGYEDFTLDSSGLDSLPGDGVFTLHIELADGQVVDQWFIVHGLAASTSPDVQSPVSAQTFSDTNPQVRWIPYQSPEYRPFERRHLGIWLSNEADDTWGFYSGHGGELGSVTIGDHPGVEKKRLAPGEYWVAVDGHELRSFGALRLVRTGRRLVSFHVVR